MASDQCVLFREGAPVSAAVGSHTVGSTALIIDLDANALSSVIIIARALLAFSVPHKTLFYNMYFYSLVFPLPWHNKDLSPPTPSDVCSSSESEMHKLLTHPPPPPRRSSPRPTRMLIQNHEYLSCFSFPSSSVSYAKLMGSLKYSNVMV